jgi:hypothetical protein
MASEDEKANKFWVNVKKDIAQLYEKVKQYPLISLLCIVAVLLLIAVPHVQVSLSGINNSTIEAAQENQNRATLAQIFGGVAIAIGLYYTWRRIGITEKELQATQENLKVAQDNLKVTQEIAENNLKVSQDCQITERFTRAIDQLGNEKIEIRLGGIYALERISNESEKDYWPIMKILAAYIREKSYIKENTVTEDYEKQEKDKPLSTDIQVILDLICKHEHSFNEMLDLRNSNLHNAQLFKAHLEGANLMGAHLEGAINLTIDQLSKVKTLYNTKLDDALLIPLQEKYPTLFEEPKV